MIQINIHSSLVRFTNNESQTKLAIDKTSHIIPVLCEHYSELKKNILDTRGELTPFVNIYVNRVNLKQIEERPLQPTDIMEVVTALVGG